MILLATQIQPVSILGSGLNTWQPIKTGDIAQSSPAIVGVTLREEDPETRSAVTQRAQGTTLPVIGQFLNPDIKLPLSCLVDLLLAEQKREKKQFPEVQNNIPTCLVAQKTLAV